MRPPSVHQRLALGLAAALALTAVACRDTATLGDRLPQDERIVVLLPEGVRGTLDPRLNTRAWPGKIMPLVFEGLVSVNNATLAAEPALAEQIEQPSPGVYDITLRPGARFSDGAPVTAADVKATFDTIRDPQLRSSRKSVYDRIQTIEVFGPKSLRITLSAPHAPFITDLSMGIVPAHHLDATGHLKTPVGAGPYAIHPDAGAQEFVLQRSTHYWRGLAATPYLVFRAVRDPNTRLLALMSGEADLIENGVSPRLADAMRGRDDLVVKATPGVGYNYLAFNLRDPILGDKRVRQAIAYAVDRERLIEHKFRGVARAATGMLPAGHWAYADDVARYPHDPARAEALLDAAGHPRPAPGAPRFRLTFKTNTDKFRRNLATLLAADLRAVGIEVEVQSFELGTLLEDAKSGNFQLYSLQWGDPTEPHMYNWIFHSDRVPTAADPNRGGNRGGYLNPEVDQLIDAGRVTVQRGVRRGIYQKLQRIVADDLPYLSLWHEDVVAVSRVGLEGYTSLPNASFYNLWQARWRTPSAAGAAP